MNVYKAIKKLKEAGYTLTVKSSPDPQINIKLKEGYTPDPAEVKPLFEILKENKSLTIDVISITDEESFNSIISKLRGKARYNPRPDIEEDSCYWNNVLKIAEKVNNTVYNILHFFRCLGCMLEIKDNNLILIPGQAIDDYYQNEENWQKDRKQYLIPYAKEIKSIFNKVMKS